MAFSTLRIVSWFEFTLFQYLLMMESEMCSCVCAAICETSMVVCCWRATHCGLGLLAKKTSNRASAGSDHVDMPGRSGSSPIRLRGSLDGMYAHVGGESRQNVSLLRGQAHSV